MIDTNHVVREVLELTPLLRRHVLRPMETCTARRMPPNQMSILSILSEGEESMAGLSRQIMVCRQQMTQLIDELEKKGFVSRCASEKDRRSVMVQLTERGRDYVSQVNQELLQILFPIFDGYTDEDKARLMTTAQTMREIMHG